MRRNLTVLVAALALVLAACFSDDPEFTEEEQVEADQLAELQTEDEDEAAEDVEDADADAEAVFVAIDNEFTEAPSEIEGTTIEFTLENEGNAVHNVYIEDVGEYAVDDIDGGESASNVIELDPGEYEYVCDIPGHEQTMNGTFTVNE